LFAIASVGVALLLTACGGRSEHGVVRCAGDAVPVDVKAMPSYVLVSCPDGSQHVVPIADAREHGMTYANGNQALADALFWSYLLGPTFRSYPVYHTYVTSPTYVRYIHSPEYRTYAASAAYRARTTTQTVPSSTKTTITSVHRSKFGRHR
jgi:hypothetical protein